jgi:prevent-host-death family protein
MSATADEKRVSVRDLRNHGGDVLARVRSGEILTITSDGTAVAELRPLPRRSLSAAELVARRRRLPRVDARVLGADIDALLDQSL